MALNASVVCGGYVPSWREGVVTGGVSSRTTAIASAAGFPRRSAARPSTPFGPSGPSTVNAPLYGIHGPPPTRHSRRAKPTLASPPPDEEHEDRPRAVT